MICWLCTTRNADAGIGPLRRVQARFIGRLGLDAPDAAWADHVVKTPLKRRGGWVDAFCMALPDGITLRELRVGEAPLHALSHRCEAASGDAGDLADAEVTLSPIESAARSRVVQARCSGEAAWVIAMLDASVMKLRATGWTVLRGVEPSPQAAPAAEADRQEPDTRSDRQAWPDRRWLAHLPEVG